jgi:hypothetical protein
MAAGAWHIMRRRMRTAVPAPRHLRPLRHPLAGGVLVASIGEPPSIPLLRLAAGWMVAAGSRRLLLLHVREVPGTLPLGAWTLDAAALAELRDWIRQLRKKGLRAELEVADTRSGARLVVERALAMRARAVLLGHSRTARGRLDRRAPYVLRRLRGIEVVLFSE